MILAACLGDRSAEDGWLAEAWAGFAEMPCKGAWPDAQHPVLLMTKWGGCGFLPFVLAAGAAPILGPWPGTKQCVAFRRHAEFEQKVTPKTGPFFGTSCHTCCIQKMSHRRAQQQEYKNWWQDFLAMAGVPPQPLEMKVCLKSAAYLETSREQHFVS